ncbi:TIR domain-containing protein [Paenibacillus sp. FSL K6-2524]|uniref:TIR domain-containing protein n=1 Tax=Paenibacillus sp. FSL K6-2524 TaxID=2954516 RepID=UPI0030F75DEE
MKDIFVSYAHSDNDTGWIDDFCLNIKSIYKKMTGDILEMFLDSESIMTADIWSSRIINSIDKSKICLAFVSPSYVKSEWCRREWQRFLSKESELKSKGKLTDDFGIILPVLLFDFERGRFSEEERIILDNIKSRQWMDLTQYSLEQKIDYLKVRNLVERVIDISYEIERQDENFNFQIESIILDSKTGLLWAGTLSASELTIDEARKYVDEINKNSKRKWRIPTKLELETLVDNALIPVNDPHVSPFPLRQPFNHQKYGYLHSSTLIDGMHDQNYIMNVRNGHIFNGHEFKAFLRLIADNDLFHSEM